VTFEDRAPAELKTWLADVSAATGLPGVSVCARGLSSAASADIIAAATNAAPLPDLDPNKLPTLPTKHPRSTLLERPRLGPAIALLLFAALFTTPVYAAYVLADWLQPTLDALILDPLRASLEGLAGTVPLLHTVLVGDYGLVTLGAYSFLWAFPVVLFIGIAMALTDETGLRDRMAGALDPLMRLLGLSGRDLLPVLSGFGCNVVAVMQTRGCSRDRRGACVSLIGFGSSCSYQLGASLSIFAAAGHPSLFAPFIVLVFAAGLGHTRLWHGGRKRRRPSLPLAQTSTWLQAPTLMGLWWRLRAVCKQFLFQAMPIFLAICAASAVLAYVGVMDKIATVTGAVLEPLFGLPATVAPAVVLSVLRKDGMLLLNQGEGALSGSLSTGALFLAVYLAATVSPCLVTLFTAGRELGARTAAAVAGRQLVTALATAVLIGLLIRM
jgi:Fe2+ transport system protein B